MSDKLIQQIRDLRDVQGRDGTWNFDPYMQGLFNGLEMALSILEQRDPCFRDAPDKWLADLRVSSVLAETEND
jgi:hypothetical protein